ncbi:MAG: tRNA (adenosine(37)-N6)-threonylcarbamoyltransferase complex dimerization subunit type 1 TsaB [Butyrivibrio sp.]|nr:tRNA (adenosine(37)-N6)-threonylcarbamoyltransferase complex dimerization subunit type 1 TsaB [Butyrivibrio sp.]
MRILAIEASSLVASAAILTDDIITAEYTVNHKKTHSQTLLPMIDEMCRMAEVEPESFDAVAVSGGPGSFTGLRIGSATAKGLGQALGIPLIHVPTLDAMAYNMYGADMLICPIMDARRSQVYTGIYSFEGGELAVHMPSSALPIEELVKRLDVIGRRTVFIGDGIPVFRAFLDEKARFEHEYAPAGMNRQRASSVALLGAEYFKAGKTVTAAEHLPNYLRASQAERERAERLSHE